MSGCIKNCDEYYRSEPMLSLFFKDTVNFSRVYALKPGPIDTLSGFREFLIPINLNSEHTIYIFESDTRTDTLELLYESEAKLISKDCGFIVELEKLHTGSLTTFDSVSVSSNNQIVVR